MPVRSRWAQVTQFGAQVSLGTGVTVNRRFGGLNLIPATAETRELIWGAQGKYPASTQIRQQRTTMAVEGPVSYIDLYHVLRMLDTPAVTTPAGATNARQGLFQSASLTADVHEFFTFEFGETGAGLADKFIDAHLRSFGLRMSRDDGIVFDGTQIVGANLQTGQTLTTAGITTYSLVPTDPLQLNIYADDSYATASGASPTQLTGADAFQFNLGDIREQVDTANSSKPSFSHAADGQPNATASISLFGDTTGIALAHLAAGTRKYLRAEVKGANIDTGVAASAYRVTVIVSVEVMEPGAYNERLATITKSPTFRIIDDGINPPWQVQVVIPLASTT